jgi:hypothetical protein
MDRFSNDREALDFIASGIADEAQREGVSFSEVERKMLYFSETAWTLPEIWEVSDEFDREYDQSKYERKTSRLIRNTVKRIRKQSPEDYEDWIAAVERLRKEDRYLLVMVKQAGPIATFRPSPSTRIRGDLLKLWGTGLALLTMFFGLVMLTSKIFPPDIETGRAGGPIETTALIFGERWYFLRSFASFYDF